MLPKIDTADSIALAAQQLIDALTTPHQLPAYLHLTNPRLQALQKLASIFAHMTPSSTPPPRVKLDTPSSNHRLRMNPLPAHS